MRTVGPRRGVQDQAEWGFLRMCIAGNFGFEFVYCRLSPLTMSRLSLPLKPGPLLFQLLTSVAALVKWILVVACIVFLGIVLAAILLNLFSFFIWGSNH